MKEIRRAVLILLAASALAHAGEPPRPAPARSRYLDVVQRSADVLLAKAIDTQGPERTGMIISVLDRRTGEPLTALTSFPNGIRLQDAIGAGGSNFNLQQDLFRALQHLSRLTGDKRYDEVVLPSLKDFLRFAQHPSTGLVAWGEHLYWDCFTDTVGDAPASPTNTHEQKRKYIYFDDHYTHDPDRALKYARGLWYHQIYDRTTGNFSRHTKFNRHAPQKDYDFAKEGSFYIDVWSRAYDYTREPVFKEAVTVLANRYVGKMNERHLMNFDSSTAVDRVNLCWVAWMLSLAMECHDSARRMDAETAKLLRELAARQDEGFLRLEHFPDAAHGFIALAFTDTGKVRPDSKRKTNGYSQDWGLGYGLNTTSMFALLVNTRQAQVGPGQTQTAYRQLLLKAADLYKQVAPDPAAADIWAGEYGMAVMVQLAAYRISKDGSYLEAARKLADAAIEVFWGADGVLPRASSKTDYYDVLTSTDTLLLSLLALHEEVSGLKPEVPLSDIVR